VDTEAFSRADQVLEIANTVYTPTELTRLAQLEPEARREDAVRLWTLKEAYMKARGMGMSIPPHTFEIDLDRLCKGVGFITPQDEDRALWDLTTRQIEDHAVAICVAHAGVGKGQVLVHHADLRAMIA
jgi:4'-phosphopantetheinyl transferase